MDPMKRVAAGAVRKNLGPDPSMGRKVELLRKLVAMRGEAPKRSVNRGLGVPGRGGGSLPAMPKRKPAMFADKPGYNFGPPKGM